MRLVTKTSEQAWILLAMSHTRILEAIETDLKNAGLPSLRWYDVLLEVERAGDKGLRPYELEHALLLPQYGVSRLVDRIISAGYLQRHTCSEDARGQRLYITKNGSQLKERMWPVYAKALNRQLEQKMERHEVEELARVLGKLAK